MSQTIRRELRNKFSEILELWYQDNPPTRDATDFNNDVAGKLADAALSVAGIAKVGRTAAWDLAHGLPVELSEADKNVAIYTSVAQRLETGLGRNQFPQTHGAQNVYRWIANQEALGESLDRFIAWATRDERAMQYTFIYHKDPALIVRDWPQAFTGKKETSDRVPETLRR